MKWTIEAPTQPKPYWCKLGKSRKTIVYVVEINGLLYNADTMHECVSLPGCLWSDEPIPEPEDDDGK